LELQLVGDDVIDEHEVPSSSERSAAELAIAAALEKATAAGSSSGSSSLCIRSCKLKGAGLDSTAILQALPGSSLTSLRLDLQMPHKADASDIHALMDRLATVLPSLQQLQQLTVYDIAFWTHELAYDRMLSGFSALTNLTSLTLPEVGGGTQCIRNYRGACTLTGAFFGVCRSCMQAL
jgi:hypothetical protein